MEWQGPGPGTPAATSEEPLGAQPLGQEKPASCQAAEAPQALVTMPCGHLPQPACIYLTGLGLARFLFAAQGLPVQGRQSPSVLTSPPTQGGCPPHAHTTQVGQAG